MVSAYSPFSSQEEWNLSQTKGTRLAVSLCAEEYLEERIEALNQRLTWVSNNLDSLEGINIEKAKLRVERLEKRYT